MSEDSELVAYLEGYRREGSLDSSGDFSLSDQKAQEKFRRFQLSEPRLYVLNLQAAAVSGGANWVDFHGDADDLYFECDADLGPAGGLADLNSVALSDTAAVPVRELALALNGCLALDPKRLQACYWDGQAGITIGWEGGQFAYQPSQEPPVGRGPDRAPSLTFHLREKPSRRTVAKFISRLGGAVAADSEQEAISRHCNRSPCPVRFNGIDIGRPLDPRGANAAVVFTDRPLPAEHPLRKLSHVEARQAPGAFQGLLARGGARIPPWLTLVVHGVNFRLNEAAFGGVRGFIFTENLRKDLSQVQLVQDRHYREIVGFAKDLV